MPERDARAFADRVDRALFVAWLIAATLFVAIVVLDPFRPLTTTSSEQVVAAPALVR